MYDLIGDIHGHASALERLLHTLGYQARAGVWQHPKRQVIFLGDFIDRGPEQQRTLTIAHAMCDAGTAYAVMGNHEFNAVAWASPTADGDGFLRPHTEKNQHQHRAFLEQVGYDPAAYAASLAWFKTLPLYLDLPELRVVHACWHPPSLMTLAPFLDERQRICEDAWITWTQPGTAAFNALETVLKGHEIPLPQGYGFLDKDGHQRYAIRTRWWLDPSPDLTYRTVALLPNEPEQKSIPDQPLGAVTLPGYDRQKPLFIGHYWLRGQPKPLTSHIACLDYSVASPPDARGQRGQLCAYRWSGETVLDPQHYVCVAAAP